MKLTQDFKKRMIDDYRIKISSIDKINSMVTLTLKGNNIILLDDEYYNLIEECCMHFSSYCEMGSIPYTKIPCLEQIVYNSIKRHSYIYNWDIEIRPVIIRKKVKKR